MCKRKGFPVLAICRFQSRPGRFLCFGKVAHYCKSAWLSKTAHSVANKQKRVRRKASALYPLDGLSPATLQSTHFLKVLSLPHSAILGPKPLTHSQGRTVKIQTVAALMVRVF